MAAEGLDVDGYIKFSLMAELGKLSQEKPTQIPAAFIAQLAIDEIRDLQRELRFSDLERMFDLPDPR